MYNFTCRTCGKCFPTGDKHKRYCSKLCYLIDKPRLVTKEKVSWECPACRKVFLLVPYVAKKRKYCSRSCTYKSIGKSGKENANWKGGYLGKNGYFYVKQNGKYRLKHVVVYESFYNISVPKDFCVHHIDGNIKNNDINNLRLISKSLHTSMHNAKLNHNQVKEIFYLYASGNYTHSHIGEIYNIDKSNISRLLSGKRIYAKLLCT